MESHNTQQQAIILKGIAQQILQMNVPSINEAQKLFNEFGYVLEKDSESIVKDKDLSDLTDDQIHLALTYKYHDILYDDNNNSSFKKAISTIIMHIWNKSDR